MIVMCCFHGFVYTEKTCTFVVCYGETADTFSSDRWSEAQKAQEASPSVVEAFVAYCECDADSNRVAMLVCRCFHVVLRMVAYTRRVATIQATPIRIVHE